MRAYFFGNFYLSSIQQGIQAAHCVAEMAAKYEKPCVHFSTEERNSFFDWAEHHITIICLNGGNSAELGLVWNQIVTLGPSLGLAHSLFREDQQSLEGALTCVGIIVPEKIYTYNDYERELNKPSRGDIFMALQLNPITLNTAEKELAAIIASAPLAR